MNPFGQELKKVLVQCKTSGPVSYVGRAAYIQLDPELRARLEFLSLNVANQYNALKLTVLNRTEGTVDVNIIRFGDLLGKKKVSNLNFSDGILPHLWDDYGKVAQWCRENHRDWRYSHLGELQVAHSGEWKKVDYFCANGGETRVYFPAEPVQEQQLQALAEDPAVHLRDLLTLGLPEHDVYLVHASADVGWVPAADLPRLTAQGKEEFSELLNARVAAIRPGPYGVELVLDGVNSQLLAQYDETLANSSRAEHAMELFL